MNKKARLEKLNQIKKEAELRALIKKASEVATADENAATDPNAYVDKFTEALIDSIVIEGLDD